MIPANAQSELNYLSAINDVISNLEKHHNVEMTKIQEQHKEVIAELKQQAYEAQKSYQDTIKKANEQVKWSRLSFYIALLTLLINMVFDLFKM